MAAICLGLIVLTDVVDIVSILVLLHSNLLRHVRDANSEPA